MSAVGGFFSGLRQGIDTGQSVRRNRKIEEVIDRELDEYDLGRSGKLDQYVNEGGNPNDFPEFNESEDPFLIRGFNWLKERFGGGRSSNPEDAFVASSTATRMPQAGVMMSADGGPVRKGIPSYADGGEVVDEDTYLDDLGRHAKRYFSNQLPSLRATSGSVGADVRMRGKDVLESEDAYEAGRNTRKAIGEGVIGTARMVSAATDDVLGPIPEALTAVGKGALGFIGFGGKHKPAAQPASAPTEPSRSALPADKQAAAEAGGSKEQPSEEIAANAMQAGVANTPGHPDSPDQDFNWAEVADAGATPDEIPHVGVNDWIEYRKNYVLASIKQGKSPAEAHQEVDEIQMRGAISNFTQASYLLKAGQPKAAALAARAAFQYFPNGSDVRLGIHQGEGGPVLVGMGIDEETGEPIREGKPMILTPETMAVMAENFSNPAAFRTWTKDWRDAVFQEKQFLLDRDVAQADAIYKDRAGRAALMRGQADLDYAASRGSSGGIKESDLRASYDRIADDVTLAADVEREDVPRIRTLATRLRQRYPSQSELSDEQITEYLINAYMSGDMSEIAQLLEQ